MTKIRMDWKNLKLELNGHAGGGPYGHDLVCCAVSTLSQSLIYALEELRGQGKTDMDWTGNAEQGYMMIDADPRKEYAAEVRHYFKFTMMGLQMIADEYPQNVEVREDL